jgi:AcrR family transcriptional regulator
MKPEPEVSTKYNTPLRQAHRDLTRSRIKDAARKLFYERHYDNTTIDEIAKDAGLRRSTLYLHYKDKAEILSDIIVEYTPKAKEALATLPGPQPSLEDLHNWVKRVARMVDKERVLLSIIQETWARNRDATAFDTIIQELLGGIGANNPVFAQAAAPDADPMLRARALMLLEELTYACGMFVGDPRDACAKALLRIAAEDFHAFLSK